MRVRTAVVICITAVLAILSVGCSRHNNRYGGRGIQDRRYVGNDYRYYDRRYPDRRYDRAGPNWWSRNNQREYRDSRWND